MTMVRTCVLLVLVCLGGTVTPPKFNVDLDEEPSERWRHVIQYYQDSGIIDALQKRKDLKTMRFAEEWFEATKHLFDDDFLGEIDGWIKYSNHLNHSRKKYMIQQLKYEMNYPSFACTGLLAAMPNGTVVHGRNMDYAGLNFTLNGKPAGWSALVTDITFYRNGQPLYNSIMMGPGQLGIHTAMRFGGWSFEQNTRRLSNDNRLNLEAAKNGGLSFGLFARRLMESTADYDTALQKLLSAKFMANHYFIMAGAQPYQAASLAIDRMVRQSSSPITMLSDIRVKGGYYILQTNDDSNKPPEDFRRPWGEASLHLTKQSQVSPKWMFNQMRSQALFMPEAETVSDYMTVFTYISIPAMGYHVVVLHRDPWPEADSPTKHWSQKGTFLSRS